MDFVERWGAFLRDLRNPMLFDNRKREVAIEAPTTASIEQPDVPLPPRLWRRQVHHVPEAPRKVLQMSYHAPPYTCGDRQHRNKCEMHVIGVPLALDVNESEFHIQVRQTTKQEHDHGCCWAFWRHQDGDAVRRTSRLFTKEKSHEFHHKAHHKAQNQELARCQVMGDPPENLTCASAVDSRQDLLVCWR